MPQNRAVRTPLCPLVWRSLAFVAVWLTGVAGFMSGIGVSEREVSGIAGSACYALGLFVLGGLDLGTPVGGPVWGRVLQWTAYFAAPVITASALIEAATQLISPLALRARTLNDHVVLGRAGSRCSTHAK